MRSASFATHAIYVRLCSQAVQDSALGTFVSKLIDVWQCLPAVLATPEWFGVLVLDVGVRCVTTACQQCAYEGGAASLVIMSAVGAITVHEAAKIS